VYVVSLHDVLRRGGANLTNGARAEAYADHFIAYHLAEMPYNGVYAAVSTAARANPTNAKLAAEVQTVFTGTTLRGLLLEAYAFSVIATIGFWAGIAAFVLAGIMAVLVAFGFWHARRTPEDVELTVHHEELKVRSEGNGAGPVDKVEPVAV